MSPKIVDKEQKKLEILHAAIKVFADKGIPNTKMIDIAREAGIGKGTIYEYFRSKQEIIKETLQAFLDELNQVEEDVAMEHEDALTRLLHIVDGWLRVALHSPLQSKVIIEFWAEEVRSNPDEMSYLKQIYGDFRGSLQALLDEAVSENIIPPTDTRLMASLIAATMDGLFLHWYLGPELFKLEDAIELYKTSLILSLKKQ